MAVVHAATGRPRSEGRASETSRTGKVIRNLLAVYIYFVQLLRLAERSSESSKTSRTYRSFLFAYICKGWTATLYML